MSREKIREIFKREKKFFFFGWLRTVQFGEKKGLQGTINGGRGKEFVYLEGGNRGRGMASLFIRIYTFTIYWPLFLCKNLADKNRFKVYLECQNSSIKQLDSQMKYSVSTNTKNLTEL